MKTHFFIRLAALCAAVLSTSTVFAFLKLPPIKDNAAEGLAYMAENIYGVRPDLSNFKPRMDVGKIEDGRARDAMGKLVFTYRHKTVKLNTMTPMGEKEFTTLVYFPKDAKGPRPLFLYISFEPDELWNGRFPVQEILKRGSAAAIFFYEDVMPDRWDEIQSIKDRAPNAWGTISAWSLAASRVVDWAVQDKDVDSRYIAVVGHSRLGKTALWTGANDSRIALTCVNDSGCFGARLHACNLEVDAPRMIGCETIETITSWVGYWFAPNARKFAGQEENLPFDQHWVTAAVAPRLLAIASADLDTWACPSGEFANFEVTKGYYASKGVAENVHYHVRHGEHALSLFDWTEYMDFAKSRGWPIK